MDYKVLIIEMVNGIDNTWILEQILCFIENMIKEGD